ncbi:PQQ-dependent dehydrogenase, methanol/ethanol family [Acetobacter pasteurianus]|nr:PQQ-dependent dehydrogenase, methanol/ethanol family [Acetobacter pasteurianus]
MLMSPRPLVLALLAASFLSPSVYATETDPIVEQADSHPENWPTYGRTYAEQRYSPLAQITDHNVQNLHLAWYQDLDTNRGQEATPLVIDGVMYISTNWSHVEALDAATGHLLWKYDPKVPGNVAVKGCCDTVNRGVAYWQGRIYVGTFDGRLISLDAKTGHVEWSVHTIPHDATLGDIRSYTVDGAPRIVKGIVIIGNGGAEFGARGFVSGFDAKTGALRWRFFTVPAPANKPDHAASDKALHDIAYPTWSPKGGWTKSGGGGTVWDSIVYDPKTDLVYLGVGNGAPWNYKFRSDGVGDNLFLASIVAIKPETGEYVWHFQETPKDQWDFTASQPIMVMDLPIHGEQRHVIVQAPKNGFFYILDAQTGEFLSAVPYTFQNWARSIDSKTGRPDINPDALWSLTNKPWFSIPGSLGGHNWAPMAYNPQTKLVYIPAQQLPEPFLSDPKWHMHKQGVNMGMDMTGLPDDPKVLTEVSKTVKGWLLAWNPAEQKAAFTIPHLAPWNGGVLTTAGNLVFQGLSTGLFEAYRATDGHTLFSFDAQTGIVAPPISYMVDGKQYIAVEAGWGGVFPLMGGALARLHNSSINHSRILVFALDGTANLPPVQNSAPQPIAPTGTFSPEKAKLGYQKYQQYCLACHGDNAVGGGVLPDLRWSAFINSTQSFSDVVNKGVLSEYGMVSFSKEISPEQVEDIRNFLLQRATSSYQSLEGKKTP